MRKLLGIILVLSLGLFLVSCTDDKIQIGILQLLEHNALTDARKGFIDELKDNGFIDGENIKITLLNPEGDDAVMTKNAKSLVRKSDLVLGIATPSAIALKTESTKQNSNVPILFTAVTDPVDAGIIESNLKPGKNITGTNDFNPISEQLALAKELLPNITTIGILYNESEPNSSIQATEAKRVASELGLEVVEKTFLNSGDIRQVANSLANDSRVKLIYTPTDNLVASNIGVLNLVSREHNVPFIVGEDTLVSELPSLTISINYYELGRLTGKMAVDILKNNKLPKDIPSIGLDEFNLAINKNALNEIGIEIPEDLLNKIK